VLPREADRLHPHDYAGAADEGKARNHRQHLP
jgi:hypothetical protein